MAFTTVPFTGPIVPDPRSFAWCSVSPNKAFLLYTGWTGPGYGGTRKLFIQPVYFNGKNAPTYGPASAVYNIPHSTLMMPSLCVLGDGRILAALQESSTTFSYYVFDVDDSDRVSFAFKSAAIATPLGNLVYQCPAVALLSGTRAISSHLPTAPATGYNNQYQLVDVGATGFTFTTVDAGPAATRAASDSTVNPKGWSAISNSMFRKDRNGKIMGIRAMEGPYYSVSSQGYNPFGYAFTSFDDQGVVQFTAGDSSLVNQGMPGAHDRVGFQKGREILPISQNTLLSIGCTDTSGYGTMRAGANSKNTFTKLTLLGKQTAVNGVGMSASAETPWRDASSVMFLDVIWLDSEYFFAIARVGTGETDDITNAYTWTVSAVNQRDCKVYVGKFNEDTGTIILGDAAPLPLPTRISNTYCSPMLHRISNTEVAILQVCQVEDTGTGIAEINITVVGA